MMKITILFLCVSAVLGKSILGDLGDLPGGVLQKGVDVVGKADKALENTLGSTAGSASDYIQKGKKVGTVDYTVGYTKDNFVKYSADPDFTTLLQKGADDKTLQHSSGSAAQLLQKSANDAGNVHHSFDKTLQQSSGSAGELLQKGANDAGNVHHSFDKTLQHSSGSAEKLLHKGVDVAGNADKTLEKTFGNTAGAGVKEAGNVHQSLDKTLKGSSGFVGESLHKGVDVVGNADKTLEKTFGNTAGAGVKEAGNVHQSLDKTLKGSSGFAGELLQKGTNAIGNQIF